MFEYIIQEKMLIFPIIFFIIEIIILILVLILDEFVDSKHINIKEDSNKK